MSTKTNRKYYLHSKIRQLGVVRDKKILDLPYNSELFDNKYVRALRDEYGYSIQTHII